MVPIPTAQEQEQITALLSTLITTLETHPQFTTPPKPHAGILHTWDFVQRTRYIMQNLENIRQGKSVEHPAMIPENPEAKDNEQRARMSFADVVTRSITVDKIINDPKMLSMMGGETVDFGDEVKTRSKEVVDGIMGLKDDTPDPTATAGAQA